MKKEIDIKNLKKVYFIGIGGSSMSGIAMILKNFGIDVAGSDSRYTPVLDKLSNAGIKVYDSHDALNISSDIDLVVYTAAINEDNVELLEAKKKNILLLERGPFLGELTKLYKNTIGVAGTHGKTSTTSMLSSVFLEASLDPSIQVGSNLNLIDGNFRVGSSDNFIIEACEYKDSFLNFYLKSAIVLNIDNDHLDYFKNLDNIKKSFYNFVSKINEDGYLIVNNDDDNSCFLHKYTKAKVVSVGIKNKADYMAKNIVFDMDGHPSFDVYQSDNYIGRIDLNIFGEFNVLNALSVIALALEYNISFENIYNGLKKYSGVSRRLEYKGKFKGADIYDDYAHHPSEILAISKAIKKKKYNRIFAIFEPHTYSRVNNYASLFAKCLNEFDQVIITDIYAAREKNIYNIDSSVIVEELYKNYGKTAMHIPDYGNIKKYLEDNIKEYDIILLIGAGDITKLNNLLK